MSGSSASGTRPAASSAARPTGRVHTRDRPVTREREALEDWLCAVMEEYDDLAELTNTDRAADVCCLGAALLATPEGAALAARLDAGQPSDMTGGRLRKIASWLDLYDRMGEQFVALTVDRDDAAKVEKLLAVLRSKDVQNDLRRWADLIDATEPDEG